MDEIFYRAYYSLIIKHRDEKVLQSLRHELNEGLPADFRRPPLHRVDKLASPQTETLLKQHAPDLCIATVNRIIPTSIFSIPRQGIFAFHPGITPEYRGVHAAFWAILNGDFDNIGWSLLRIDDGIDTGGLVAQGRTHDVNPQLESHVAIQHRAHCDGLVGLVDFLKSVEKRPPPFLSTSSRVSRLYTHPGLTDYLKLCRRLKQTRQESSV